MTYLQPCWLAICLVFVILNGYCNIVLRGLIYSITDSDSISADSVLTTVSQTVDSDTLTLDSTTVVQTSQVAINNYCSHDETFL